MLGKLERFHQTKKGYLFFAALELLLAYVTINGGLESGNLFWYALALVLFIGSLRNLFLLIGKLFNGERKTSRTR